MKHSTITLWLIPVLPFVIGSLASAEEAAPAQEAVPYSVTVNEFEGCECESVCPCIFSKDTSYGDCRATLVFTFNGHYGSTELKDASCVLIGLHLGNNIDENMGNWKGVLYTSDKASEEEVAAIKGLLHAMMGDAFANLDERKADIRIQTDGDIHDLTLGEVGRLRIHPIKNAGGAITQVANAPSPIAFPVMYCAIAEEHTYNDGTASWSFPGRNGFFAEFVFSNEE